MKIKSFLFTPLSLGLILYLFSCQKKSVPAPGNQGENGDNNPLLGTWVLNSITWNMYNSSEFTDGADLKQVNSYIDTTVGAKGTFTFSDSSVSISNIGYSMTGSYADTSYQNGAITNAPTGHVTRTLRDSSMINSYRLIGQDSVFFPTGSEALRALEATGAVATAQSGASFVIDGNTLTMTSIVDSVTHIMVYTTIVDTIRTDNRIVSVFTRQ